MARNNDKGLETGLFLVVTAVLVFTLALLAVNLTFQYNNYSRGIAAVFLTSDPGDHTIALTYSRAWDFAVVKTSSLFISFVLIFTGALYVLRAAESKLEASIEHGAVKGTLAITSPGLALAVLGVGLVCFTLYNKSDVFLQEPGRVEAMQSSKSSAE